MSHFTMINNITINILHITRLKTIVITVYPLLINNIFLYKQYIKYLISSLLKVDVPIQI